MKIIVLALYVPWSLIEVAWQIDKLKGLDNS